MTTGATAPAKKASTRVYKVVELDAKMQPINKRLVRASQPARALKHVVTPRFLVEVADMNEVIELVKAGTEVETATTEE